MKKILKLIKWDLFMQYKYGLITAGIIMSIVWICVLLLFSPSMIPSIIPLVLLGDLATMGYMFIAASLYFEKGQGSIYAVIATPVKTKDYIKSKIVSLLIYILIVSFIVVYIISIIKGLNFNVINLFFAIIITSVFYMTLSLLMATKYKNFTDFLFPTGLIFTVLLVPALGLLNLEQLQFMNYIYYVWPTHGMILLMKGIFNPISTFDLIYALTFNIIIIYILYKKSIKLFNIKLVGRRGDIDE